MIILKTFIWRGLVTAMLLAFAGCQTSPSATVSGVQASMQSTLAQAPQLRQDIFQRIYEVTVSPASDGVFVATNPSGNGTVYRLDPRTLQVLQTIQLPRGAYALGLNNRTRTLYVGNSRDGSITTLDASTGQIKHIIQLAQPEKSADGKETMPHTRKVIVDEAHDRAFVTNPSRQGKVWIVDGVSGTLRHTVQAGLWPTGAVYDATTNRLYVGQSGVNEILVIDPDTGTIVQRYATGDGTADTSEGSKHFFINLTLDASGQRLFATDPSTNQVYVFDTVSGRVLHHMPVHGVSALDIVYSPQRNEIITTSRGATDQQPHDTGAVTIFDATTYALKRVIDLPVHPNSLALSPDGQTLYVTVKVTFDKTHPAWREDARGSIVRIDLG